MLLVQAKLKVNTDNIHNCFIKRYIIQLWENYISIYTSHKRNDLEDEHIYIAYKAIDDTLLYFAYFFPDKIVEDIGLNHIKEVMPYWSTYEFIAEEEKYKLEEMVKNNGT